ncbi:uncharacterized protein LOC107636546 [Arachis ipaensis]|uniref:uncharacterized protein LOC107636546 n=1 Tax=Arachis ipaensis TaxID=130454 RepID=UPI0007AFDC50|nr:uncharacterized protein LOC107636546 [Arachis ipaensis]XP_025647670.1 uncharacterized protein LOC112742646 [Arachis hypogaea]
MEAMLANLCKESEDIKKFREEVRSNLQNQDAATQKIEAQVGYLSKQAPGYSSGNSTKITSREECKAITLKSGRELTENSRETHEEKAEGSSDDKEEAQTPAPNPSEEKEVLRLYVPKAPYPQRLMKNAKDSQFSKFLEIFKKLQINIPLVEDPGSFQIPCIIGKITVEKALCDFGASINLMSLTMMKRMKIEEAKQTRMALRLADRSFKFSHGIVEDLLVKVGDFIFHVDFVVLDMEEEAKASIIFGRPFLATAGAIIDVQKGELTLKLHDERMVFNVFKAMSYLMRCRSW